MLVLDSGGLSRVSGRTRRTAALIAALRREGLWPPAVPTIVLAQSTSGRARTDANMYRLLKSCDVDAAAPEATERRAGQLRARARRGSAVDAMVVALAEPGATVMTSDREDLEALATTPMASRSRSYRPARPPARRWPICAGARTRRRRVLERAFWRAEHERRTAVPCGVGFYVVERRSMSIRPLSNTAT